MRITPAPISVLDELSDSTYYKWVGRIGKLHQICIWAAWRKARKEGVFLTLESIFGESGFAGYVYRDMRSDEMIVAFDTPGEHYEFYGEFHNARKSTSDPRSGEQLTSSVHLTGLAVDEVLKAKLGDDDLRTLLRYLPFFGKFKGEALPFNEKAGVDDKRKQIAQVIDESGRSLRDSYRPRYRLFLEDSDVVKEELQRVLDNETVRRAILVLEKRYPMLRGNHKSQPVLIEGTEGQ